MKVLIILLQNCIHIATNFCSDHKNKQGTIERNS